MAIILTALLLITIGTIDFGLGVFRYHLVAQAAREATREAIVHGRLSHEPWGPESHSGTVAGAGHPITGAISPFILGMDASEVQVTADWIDGGNDPLDPIQPHRVRVTVSVPFRPIATFLFGSPTFTLTGSSTMTIAH